MSEPLKVYIVLVNYKGWQDTAECLESLYKLTYSNFNVVVVDNGSPNGSIDQLQKWAAGASPLLFDEHFYSNTSIESSIIGKPLPYVLIKGGEVFINPAPDHKLTFIASENNLGFAGGNNIGIRLAIEHQADYIWLLNNDTVVAKNSLQHLVRYAEAAKKANRRLGIVGAKLLYYHNPASVQALLGRYKPLMATTEHIGLNQKATATGEYLQIGDDDYIVGASMFVSAAFVREVGLMSEDYFLYFEEIDWVKRGREKHYGIDVCLDAVVYHKEGASIGGGIKDNDNKSKLSDFYSIRNRLLITKKFYRKYLLPVYISLIFVAANRIKRKQFNRIPLIVKAIKSSLRRTT